jgi:hypothetical protein
MIAGLSLPIHDCHHLLNDYHAVNFGILIRGAAWRIAKLLARTCLPQGSSRRSPLHVADTVHKNTFKNCRITFNNDIFIIQPPIFIYKKEVCTISCFHWKVTVGCNLITIENCIARQKGTGNFITIH